MEKFQNKYCIPSARANWHDYKGGVYFVTICTKNREHYFGEICPGPQMQLSPIGQYAYNQFINVKTHYPYAKIPLFVIMPDHIHAIVTIDGENEIGGNGVHTQCTDVARRCGDVARICGDVARICGDVARNVSTNHHANLQHFSQYNRIFCPIPPDCG